MGYNLQPSVKHKSPLKSTWMANHLLYSITRSDKDTVKSFQVHRLYRLRDDLVVMIA